MYLLIRFAYSGGIVIISCTSSEWKMPHSSPRAKATMYAQRALYALCEVMNSSHATVPAFVEFIPQTNIATPTHPNRHPYNQLFQLRRYCFPCVNISTQKANPLPRTDKVKPHMNMSFLICPHCIMVVMKKRLPHRTSVISCTIAARR